MGDACDLPVRLRAQHFDLVYSNSVLEHVGGFARRCAFAETARGLGEHLWVQTPYRYFPLEPHWLFPFFQLLPLALRAQVTLRWPIGHYGRLRDYDQAVRWSASIERLTVTELAYQFPDSENRARARGRADQVAHCGTVRSGLTVGVPTRCQPSDCLAVEAALTGLVRPRPAGPAQLKASYPATTSRAGGQRDGALRHAQAPGS